MRHPKPKLWIEYKIQNPKSQPPRLLVESRLVSQLPQVVNHCLVSLHQLGLLLDG